MEYNIPGYELGKQLGEGQYGVVFKARHKELNQDRAVKILKEGDKKSYARYRREMKALSKINHPHIVQFYEYGTLENKLPYFVMEYIEGKTLEEELKECKYTPEEAVERILPLTSALQAMHNKGIMHRDIKPGNILIDKAGKVYLTDFGLAKGKKDEGVTQTGQMLGTPKYMSPEQTLGEKEQINHQTDIYSLGAVFYELLTGRVPHEGDNMFELLHKINEEKIIPPSELNKRIPKDVEHICLKMLNKKKGMRYQDARDIEEDCYLFLDGEAISRGYNIKNLFRELVRDYKEVVVGVTCGFGILLGGIGYVQYKNQELDKILRRKQEYRIDLEEEVKVLQKSKEKNKQMIQMMNYIDTLESGNIPAKLADMDGANIMKEESHLVKEELQEYVQGLLIRNKGYGSTSYKTYIENMIRAGKHFLEAFALSENNLWYLSLGFECHHLNIHYHKVGHVGVREINKYFYKNNKLLFPEKNKQFLLFRSNISDEYLQTGDDTFECYNPIVKNEEVLNDVQELNRQLRENPNYIAGYFMLGAISGSLKINGNVYNTFFDSSTFDKIMEGYIRYPLSPTMMNRIVHEHYENAVKNYSFKNELQFTSMLEVALKINPYHMSNLYLLMETKRSRYVAYRQEGDIKEAVQIADSIGKMQEEYTKYFTSEVLLKNPEYKYSTPIRHQLSGVGAIRKINGDRVTVYLHAKEYQKELETIEKIRYAQKYNALRSKAREHAWADSSKEKNKYYLRKAQLLEHFGRYEEALEEYRLTKELYNDSLDENDKGYIVKKTVINNIDKRIEEVQKKIR